VDTRKRGEGREEPRKRRLLRQWLNGLFLVGAVVGMGVYFLRDEEVGTYIILGSMVPKMVEASMRMFVTWCLLLVCTLGLQAQDFQDSDGFGNLSGTTDGQQNQNFNPHNNDTTKQKKVPRGIYVWTIDRRFGDRQKATPDTLMYLFPRTVFANGRHGEYNTTGNNFTPRLNRIFIDRPLTTPFLFTQSYDQVLKEPDQWHFTNTLSPFTNLSYNNCGNKTNGEDHLDARFAVNAGKRTGMGFDIDYAYARGFFQNQSTSHFGATLYGSHLGDRYQMHVMASFWHEKEAENGGIIHDDYVRHPEQYTEQYAFNEIPVILSQQWNRTDHQHLFLTHRYNVGFYRKVPMTPEELAARDFARKAAKEHEKEEEDTGKEEEGDKGAKPTGRPKGATVFRKPTAQQENKTDTTQTLTLDSIGRDPLRMDRDSLLIAQLQNDTTRIKVENQQQADSLNTLQARQDSIDDTMKDEYVPVTSFIHTLELGNNNRRNQAYASPKDYYAHTYYGNNPDAFDDETHLKQVKNTLAIALLEGFNKYAKAGLKLFATHDLQQFRMGDIGADSALMENHWTEHHVSIGAQLLKTQGRTLHYGLTAETWVLGEAVGQLKADFNTDLNLRFLGDTVRLAAKAHLYRLHPTFYQRHYHSMHYWWDDDLQMETRLGVEGVFTLERTNTQLRVGIEQMDHHTYLGMSYADKGETRQDMTATMRQSGPVNVLTAQLKQNLRLGPLHWNTILTYQNSTDKEALPLPALNAFSTLFLKFRIARVLNCELGASATYFTEYYAPDYVPQLGLFGVQENEDSRVKLGNYPFVDAYINFHLKQARFFLCMGNLLNGKANRMAFLAPHYPTNGNVLRFGISWNFYN